MAIKNELSILTKAEQLDLYSPPLLTLEQQRLYFTQNEIELTESFFHLALTSSLTICSLFQRKFKEAKGSGLSA